MVKKVAVNKELRESMSKALAQHTMQPSYQKMVKEVIAFSDAVYARTVSSGFLQALNDIGADHHWLKYNDRIAVKSLNPEFKATLIKVDFSSFLAWSENKLSEYQTPIFEHLRGTGDVTLFFSEAKPLPLNNSSEIFKLTPDEIANYNKIMQRWVKKFDKLLKSLAVARVIINNFNYFEDLFKEWPSSEKIFKSIYESRKEQILHSQQPKYVPSVDLAELNEDLNL